MSAIRTTCPATFPETKEEHSGEEAKDGQREAANRQTALPEGEPKGAASIVCTVDEGYDGQNDQKTGPIQKYNPANAHRYISYPSRSLSATSI